MIRPTLLLLLLLPAISSQAYADLAIIVHPTNTLALTKQDVARIFLGRQRFFGSNTRIIPIDLPTSSSLYDDFSRTVLRRHSQQVRAYWAQQLFTGKGTPPRSAASPAEVKKLVAENPACIGYIDTKDTDDTVKVLFEVKEPTPF